jgi:hypothetical protein
MGANAVRQYRVDPAAWECSAPAQETAAFRVDSPSLFQPKEKAQPAFEMKFLLPEELARAVEARLQSFMARDVHGDPSLGGGYRTTSLYCDTPQYDVYFRRGLCRRRKHRLRRYGQAGEIFLERKTKRGQRVRKRRSSIPVTELSLLGHPLSLVSWSGHWFHRQLLNRQLQPVCRITYDRSAYMGMSAEGPIRLTFDRSLRGCLSPTWCLDPVQEGNILLPGEVICEFKFRNTLPSLFKGIIEELQLAPGTVSKYRRFLSSTGMMPVTESLLPGEKLHVPA